MVLRSSKLAMASFNDEFIKDDIYNEGKLSDFSDEASWYGLRIRRSESRFVWNCWYRDLDEKKRPNFYFAERKKNLFH